MAEEKTLYVTFVDDETRVFHAVATDFFAAVEQWRQQDQAYIRGELPEDQWLGFTAFMNRAGFAPLPHVKVRIGG